MERRFVVRRPYSCGRGTLMADWRVAGTYLEACNCEAICPCRRQGGQKLTTGSTYGVCDFALSWRIVEGETVRRSRNAPVEAGSRVAGGMIAPAYGPDRS